MTGVAVLDQLQLLTFLGAGLAAVLQWRRQRTAPAAYLAGAFGLLSLAVLATRSTPDIADSEPWFNVVVPASLAAFPWLLAAFAWSFEGTLPRWLKLAGLGVPALTAWAAVLPPLVAAESRTADQRAFLAVFLLLWSVLAAATAQRLWRAGSRQRLVRARMRLMATGALLLTVSLLISAGPGAEASPALDVVTSLLALASVALFAAGFAPPLPLRVWWRRRSSHQFQRMQVALIGAATPAEVGQAVAPMVADLLGGGVAVIDDRDGILAVSQLSDTEVAEIVETLSASRSLPEGTRAFDVAHASLIVRSTPYTPIFGQDEYELVEAFSIHLRLALERAELYRSEQSAREESQLARADLESALYSLSHDLKSPSLAISGFADLLPEAASDAERDEMLAHIKASAAYLHQLVDALLELSRVGRTQVETAPVDLAQTVAKVATRAEGTHPEATVRVQGPLPIVELNPVRAEQLLDNLIGNALVHGGRPDVSVTVSAQRGDGDLELIVADDGRGIPEQDRERVFELFQRGSTGGNRGSGVGLGMVRRIAESFDGTLELTDSEVGARFAVRVPGHRVVADGGPAETDVAADEARASRA